MRNNSVKLFRTWASGSGGDVVKKISYLELLLSGRNHLCNFESGHQGEHLGEVI